MMFGWFFVVDIWVLLRCRNEKPNWIVVGIGFGYFGCRLLNISPSLLLSYL